MPLLIPDGQKSQRGNVLVGKVVGKKVTLFADRGAQMSGHPREGKSAVP